METVIMNGEITEELNSSENCMSNTNYLNFSIDSSDKITPLKNHNNSSNNNDAEHLTSEPSEVNISNNNLPSDVSSKKRKKEDVKINNDDLNINNRPRRNTPRKSVFEMLQGDENEAVIKKPKKNHIDFSSDSEVDKDRTITKKQTNVGNVEPSFEPQLFEGPMLERKEKRRRTTNEIKLSTIEKKKKNEPMKVINMFDLESDDSSDEENINGELKAEEDDKKDEIDTQLDDANKQPWFIKQSQETNDRLRIEELSQINSELRSRIAELEGGDRLITGDSQNKKFNFYFQSRKFNRIKNAQDKDCLEKQNQEKDVVSNDKDKRRHESILDARQTKLMALDAELDRRMANVKESEGRITRAERNLRERKDALDYKEKMLKASKLQSIKDGDSAITLDTDDIAKKKKVPTATLR